MISLTGILSLCKINRPGIDLELCSWDPGVYGEFLPISLRFGRNRIEADLRTDFSQV